MPVPRSPSGEVPKRRPRSAASASRTNRSATPAPAEAGRVRLQKLLAEAGIASRRACEEMILAGEVEVNGKVVRTLPCLVDPRTDRVEVGSWVLGTPPPRTTVMLFKPRGVVSTNQDPHGRKRAIDLVPMPPGRRLYPVGRLDIDSSGLLLLTDDGELANRLTHPRYGVHKTYEVGVVGRVEPETIERLRRGLHLYDRRSGHASRTAPVEVKLLSRARDRSTLLMDLSEGRNRQVRRMLEQLGHAVRRLRRVRFGPLRLAGLRSGEWRALTPIEAMALERAASRGAAAAEAAARPPKGGGSSKQGGAARKQGGRTPVAGRKGGAAATGHSTQRGSAKTRGGAPARAAASPGRAAASAGRAGAGDRAGRGGRRGASPPPRRRGGVA